MDRERSPQGQCSGEEVKHTAVSSDNCGAVEKAWDWGSDSSPAPTSQVTLCNDLTSLGLGLLI